MTNSSSFCESLQHSPFFIVLAGLSSISGLICVVGNVIVIVTICKTKSLHTVSYILISSLAFADGLVGALLNPLLAVKLILYRYLEYKREADEVDIPDDFFWIQGLLVSTFSLTAISVDRFLAITKSIYYRSIMTIHRCWMIIVFAWLVPTLTAFTRIFLKKDNFKWLWLTTIVIAVVFPLSITSFCYCKIFKSAREQARKLEVEKIRNTKAAKTMAIVLTVFAVSYSPSIIIACIHAFKKMNECEILRLTATGWSVASLIAYSSSAINPWIYAMRLTVFRRAMRKAFGLKRRRARRLNTCDFKPGTLASKSKDL